MKILQNAKNYIYITLVFYVCLFFIPSFKQTRPSFDETFSLLFSISVVNCLIYIIPVVLAVFLMKSQMKQQHALFFLAVTDFLLLIFMHTELYTAAGHYTYAILAITMILFVCININEYAAILCLVPFLFFTKLGITDYILTANIPLMFLLMLRSKGCTDKSKKRIVNIVSYILLYISVLYLILVALKKIHINAETTEFYFNTPKTCINLISAILVSVIVFAVLCATTLKITKEEKLKDRLVPVISYLFIFLFTVPGIMTNLIFRNYKTHIIFIFLIATMFAMQTYLSYKDKSENLCINKNAVKTAAIATASLFCLFIF